MKKEGLKFILNENGKGGTLEINGLSSEHIAYAVGLISMAVEEKSGVSQDKWLDAISKANEAMRSINK